MKSAMQELIEELKQAKELEANPFVNTTIGLILNIAESKLEKEKQQIIEAGNKCAFKQHLHEAKINKMTNDELLKFAEQKTDTFGEDYYNETFS